MDDFLRGVGLILFGIGATWFTTMALGRLVSRKGTAAWVWNRSGTIGRVLTAAGLALAMWGFSMGSNSTGTSLILLGSLILIAGLWMLW